MKVYCFLFFTFSLSSCGDVSRHAPSGSATPNPDWETKLVRKQTHVYTASGVLDTTYRIEEYYTQGELNLRTNSLIIRSYSSNKHLTRERFYTADGKKQRLSEVTLFEYDTKNKLILRKEIFENVLGKISRFKYNDLGQTIEEMRIEKQPDAVQEGWTLDSALAHHNDHIVHRYDTVTIQYKYDLNGAVTELVRRSPNGLIGRTVILFKGNVKDVGFEINRKGDTVSFTRYQQKNNLMIEIRSGRLTNHYTDTTVYEGSRKLQSVLVNAVADYRHKETFRYDAMGNEVLYMLLQ